MDANFAEICDDIETLISILDSTESDLDPQAKNSLLESIHGLENEISAEIALDDSSTNSKERNTR